MSEWLNKVFSGGVSLDRVNPAGLALMALAVAAIIAANPVSRRWPEEKRGSVAGLIRLAGLLLCAAGAAIAIL